MASPRDVRWLTVLLVSVIVLGVAFRLTHLGRKIYWHDEVYTSLRAAGYTRLEIDETLFQNHFVPASDLHKFQQIKPGSTSRDTVASLRLEDPQHPPLYFLMARGWLHLFGSSRTASRLLPALLSLISLPLMYGLAQELFQSALVAWLATAFLAISPFDMLFAQTARQYSLLTLAVIAASWALVRAMTRPGLVNWGMYALAVVLGLYTHPFFGLSLIAFAVYWVMLSGVRLWQGRNQRSDFKDRTSEGKLQIPSPFPLPESPLWSMALRQGVQFALANAIALGLYLPWLLVIVSNHQRMLATTDWARFPVPLIYLVKLWILSFTSLFIDLDFGLMNPLTFLLRAPFVLLIGVSLYWVCRKTSPATSLLILASLAVPFLILVIPDLLQGGKRSAVTRYLIACFPAVQLAVAFGFASWLGQRRQWSRWLLGGVLTAAIASCAVSAQAYTWWAKDLSFDNAKIAQIVNSEAQKGSPVIVSDIGEDYTNTGDLISLSYDLDDSVRLYVTRQLPDLRPLQGEPLVFFLRPSTAIRNAIARQNWTLSGFEHIGRFWQLRL